MIVYICAGIGDMMVYDAMLTQDERDSITEIYWGCKHGKTLASLVGKNLSYRNVGAQHILNEQQVIDFFKKNPDPNHPGNPLVSKFWHFRPDIPSSFSVAMQLFNISENTIDKKIDLAALFMNPYAKYMGSSFIMNASLNDFDWKKYNVEPNKYILIHYSSNQRPDTDVGHINDRDWEIIDTISKKENWPIIIITDIQMTPPINNCNVLYYPEISSIIALSKHAGYYVGIDSFVAVLCTKVLAADKLYIKCPDWIPAALAKPNAPVPHFLPHDLEKIRTFWVKQR